MNFFWMLDEIFFWMVDEIFFLGHGMYLVGSVLGPRIFLGLYRGLRMFWCVLMFSLRPFKKNIYEVF